MNSVQNENNKHLLRIEMLETKLKQIDSKN